MVTFLKVKNDAISTLASDINDTVNSLTVASGGGALFPDEYPFHVSIGREILSCTLRSTDTMTVARAQQGTTAASHSAGDVVELRYTAKHLDDIIDEILRIGGELLGMEDILTQQLEVLQNIETHLSLGSGEELEKEED